MMIFEAFLSEGGVGCLATESDDEKGGEVLAAVNGHNAAAAAIFSPATRHLVN